MIYVDLDYRGAVLSVPLFMAPLWPPGSRVQVSGGRITAAAAATNIKSYEV